MPRPSDAELHAAGDILAAKAMSFLDALISGRAAIVITPTPPTAHAGASTRITFDHGPASEETSAEIASIAGRLLNHPEEDVRKVAASALTQTQNRV